MVTARDPVMVRSMASVNHLVKAASDEVGLRRESSIETGDIPMWLARVHRSLPVGSTVRLSISGELPVPHDDLLEGAGFRVAGVDAVRLASIPDTVRPRMRMLICGLNPGHFSAEAGVSFARNGNRFWPAALAAGIVTEDRAADRALSDHGVGFTDLAKRASGRADEITAAEFRSGASRVERLVEWLRPEIVVMVGLTGWRLGVDRRAVAGWQDEKLGGCHVYLMPNTSGLNTHESLETLTTHLTAAQEGPE